jgi:hypothetical protein
MIPCRSDYVGIRSRARLPRCENVRVPDNAVRSVGFVSEVVHSSPEGDDLDHFATGFFVSMPSLSLPGIIFMYFVTAKHIAKEFEGRDVRLLVNKKGGGIKQIRGIGDLFWGHPTDSAADVAVMPIYAETDMDIVYTPIQNFVNAKPMESGIGIGDEIFMVGLFSVAPGKEKIVPIVRHGNIAMLPEEKIQTELGFADVYLIEARSIGGLSGSPVFARPPVLLSAELRDGDSVEPVVATGGVRFLGVAHGHWDIREADMNNPHYTQTSLHGVNMGIAIVTPAYKLLETLTRPELVELRTRIEENYRRANTPGMDSPKPD